MTFKILDDRALRQSLPAFDQAARAALSEIGQEHARLVKEELAKIGRIDTGNLRQGVQAGQPRRTSNGWEVEVGVSPPEATKAVVVEEGRRAGKPVSAEGRRKLSVWARRKAKAMVDRISAEIRAGRGGRKRKPGALPVREEAEQRAAFLIARAIRRRGLPAFKVFDKARRAMLARAPEIVRRVFARFLR